MFQIRSRCKQVFAAFDNDETGRHFGQKIFQDHGIHTYFTPEYNDISDYVEGSPVGALISSVLQFFVYKTGQKIDELGAVEYNCPQLVSHGVKFPKCITVDWITINVLVSVLSLNKDTDLAAGTEIEISEDVTLISDGRTAKYAHRLKVLYQGSIFGTALACPYSPLFDERLVQIKLENHLFYSMDWMLDLLDVINAFDGVFHSVSELHIAIDSFENKTIINFMDRWMMARETPEWEPLGRQDKRIGKFRPIFASNNHLLSFDWGSKSGRKHLTVYDKTQELMDCHTKEYISEYHLANGLVPTPDEHVWRAEIKLKKDELDKYPDFDFTKLDDVNYLASLFENSLENWFQFVPTTGNKNRNKRKRKNLIDFTNLETYKLKKEQVQPKDALYVIRITIKQMYKYYLADGDTQYRDMAFRLIAKHKLKEWYHKVKDNWINEFLKKNPDKKLPVDVQEYLVNEEISLI